jgi:site-specific DNA-methyltransferase (adenine-specific)
MNQELNLFTNPVEFQTIDKCFLLNLDSHVLLKNIRDKSINCILTDPPYGINYKSGRQIYDRKIALKTGIDVKVRNSYFNQIQGDAILSVDWYADAYRILENNSAIYLFCHWKKYTEVVKQLEHVGFKIKNMIVMNKSNHGSGDLKGSYAPKHELVIFAVKGNHKLNFPKGRTCDVINAKIIYTGAKKKHPNEKPISWLIPFIENSTKEGDILLDPFMGCGSTGVAAMQYNIKFIGIEIDKDHYFTAVNNIKNYSQFNQKDIV